MSKAVEKSLTVKGAWDMLPEAFGKMLTDVRELGNLVAYLLDNDPQSRDRFRELGITPAVYTRLEKVGRGMLLPELFDSGMFGRLPVDQQRQIVAGSVTAVVEKPGGGFDTIQVDLLRADPVTVYQVVATDHIRTPAEQRQIIERKRTAAVKTPAQAADMPWRVVGKTVVFRRDCAMTRNDLLSALRALEV